MTIEERGTVGGFPRNKGKYYSIIMGAAGAATSF
jgi:hypothetical protein